jgi:hypothetical protein
MSSDALFARFRELVEACGPSEEVERTTIVYWRRERIFAGAFVKSGRLELNIDLLRTAAHPCCFAAFNTTKRVVTHRLRIEDAAQLDESIAALLREAYADVGPGTRKRVQRPHI